MKPLLFFLIVPIQLSFSEDYKTINYDTIKAVLIKTLGNLNYFETEACENSFYPFIYKANELVLKLNSHQDEPPENKIAIELDSLCQTLIEPIDGIFKAQLITNNIDPKREEFIEEEVDDETLKIYRQLYKQTYRLFLPLSQCWVE